MFESTETSSENLSRDVIVYGVVSRTVNETLLEQVVIDAINRVLCRKDDFLQTLRANIATVVLQGDALSPEVMDGTPEQAAKGAPAESQPEGRLRRPRG